MPRIQRRSEKIFFLYLSQFAVHLPFDPDAGFIKKIPCGGFEKPEASYATMIEGMEKSLGDLMHYLEKHDLVDNTITVFLSDNGGYTCVTLEWQNGDAKLSFESQ